ncbi:MAG: DNA repair protein RecO [Anaerolineaceae bacterium]|nr:DNA repair protein RecO [Anaerolineaceae bacterium]MDD4042654.1 DNA repair protein RecO [Anaerolineaceae bacterium]MDD4577898.1 DNA repair protein RecO [Anaerolineaceae bacterium]
MATKEARSYRAQALVIRHREFGEADRILTLYTLEKGKLQAIAKGVRKLKSRKAGHLEPFTQVSLQLAKGRNLEIVTQAETIRNFDNIRENLKLTAQAAYVLELLDRLTYEEGENRLLYNLVVETLSRLDAGISPGLVVHYYEVHLMDILGFKPQLQECVVCGAAIQPENQYFSARLGGVVCPQSLSGDPGAWQVSMDALRYMRFFQRSPWPQVKNRSIPEEVDRELSQLIEKYLTYLLEYNLKTPGFLDAIS